MINLGINDVINVDKKTKIKVSEIVNDKKKIFECIKNGISFDDEVLKIAGIKKTIRDVEIINVITEHNAVKKELPKETESLKNILKSIHTISNENQYKEPEQQLTENEESNDYEE